jgi:hypothetical protein
MIGLSGAVVLASLWFAVSPDAWGVIEDQYGPVRAVAVFELSAAAGVLGLKRTVIAGWLMVSLGVLPIAASSLGWFRRCGLTICRQYYPAHHWHPLPGLSKAGSSLGPGVPAGLRRRRVRKSTTARQIVR